jgi:tetratricopeptide (TPR) repeat protein
MIFWLIPGIVFFCLGIYGAMSAISHFMRGYASFNIFGVKGAVIYLVLMIVSGSCYLSMQQNMPDFVRLYFFILMPFACLGHVFWAVGFVMQLVFNAAAPTQLPVEQTFDIGDGLMLKGKYAEAEAQFRQDLAAEPLNVNAQLRLIRAMEASGKLQEAVEELYRAHKTAIAEQHNPKLKKEDHQQRILRITFALGDILTMKFDDPPRALALYRNTLEVLAGFPDAEVLRDRLQVLESPNRLSINDAVEKTQPTKIHL